VKAPHLLAAHRVLHSSGVGQVSPGDDVEEQRPLLVTGDEAVDHRGQLRQWNAAAESAGLAPVILRPAEELLEDEDLIEMVDAGLIPMTVVDEHKAEPVGQGLRPYHPPSRRTRGHWRRDRLGLP